MDPYCFDRFLSAAEGQPPGNQFLSGVEERCSSSSLTSGGVKAGLRPAGSGRLFTSRGLRPAFTLSPSKRRERAASTGLRGNRFLSLPKDSHRGIAMPELRRRQELYHDPKASTGSATGEYAMPELRRRQELYYDPKASTGSATGEYAMPELRRRQELYHTPKASTGSATGEASS